MMYVALPETITPETLALARQAAEVLRAATPPPGLTPESLGALLAAVAGLAHAVEEDSSDLTPSQAAERLRMARPTVMRLIARGDLSARKDSGHYRLSPHEIRAFHSRLSTIRREALGDLTRMAAALGF